MANTEMPATAAVVDMTNSEPMRSDQMDGRMRPGIEAALEGRLVYGRSGHARMADSVNERHSVEGDTTCCMILRCEDGQIIERPKQAPAGKEIPACQLKCTVARWLPHGSALTRRRMTQARRARMLAS